MGSKLGVKFWLYLFLSLSAGAVSGFFLTKWALEDILFWRIGIGACLGWLSGGGMLFWAPLKSASEAEISFYPFWVMLPLGSTLAIGAAEANTEILSFVAANIAGFILTLGLYLWSEFRGKKEKY